MQVCVVVDKATNEIIGQFFGNQEKREQKKKIYKRRFNQDVDILVTDNWVEDTQHKEAKKGKVRNKPPKIRDEIEEQRKAQEVRITRNCKLQDCDWTQNTDAAVDKKAWRKYRQDLKDLPDQPGFPFEVVWPVPPTK